jgi:P27 family predicted phage terminase small subunit
MLQISIPSIIKEKALELRYWNDTIPLLGDSIEKIDIAVLTNFCLAYARATRAEKYLRHEGWVIKGTNGQEQPRPEVAIAREAWKEVRSCADRLGLSPAARKRINSNAAGGDDDNDDFSDLDK